MPTDNVKSRIWRGPTQNPGIEKKLCALREKLAGKVAIVAGAVILFIPLNGPPGYASILISTWMDGVYRGTSFGEESPYRSG